MGRGGLLLTGKSKGHTVGAGGEHNNNKLGLND